MENFLHVSLEVIFNIFSIALMVISPWLIQKTNEFLKLQAGSQAADDLDAALEHALGMVQTEMSGFAKTSQTHKTIAINNAASMVMKLAPNAEKHLSITHGDVVKLINAKL